MLVAVLCYSRLCYIEFSLSERKAEFYRCLVNALTFFGGSPRKIIFDNLKTAVLSGSGRTATLHPEFLELCGHYYLEPIACAARDPESKGTVEAKVRYVKQNALAGRDHELTCWDDYQKLATYWRDEVANVRIHDTLKQRPIDRFQEEQRQKKHSIEEAFAALGEAAQTFHLKLLKQPVKPLTHLRRLLKLADLYGRDELLPAIEQAIEYETYDASYVEAILHQRRRKRELPSPTEVLPRCPEWIEETDYEPTDPASYDRFLHDDDSGTDKTETTESQDEAQPDEDEP